MKKAAQNLGGIQAEGVSDRKSLLLNYSNVAVRH